jgi:hypothetical protein
MTTTTTRAMRIRCAAGADTCPGEHATAYEVFCCYVTAGKIEGVFPCSWLMEVPGEDGPYHVECGAPSRMYSDGTGYSCALGHSHTDAQARQAQGWDYAADAGEAEQLARAFVEPRTMTGQVWPR